MAEILTHVLVAFVLFTVTGWAIEWIDRRWVVVGIVGSILPDLNRIGLVIDDHAIGQLLAVPFSWGAIHTLGGVLLLAGIGAVLFPDSRTRRRSYGMLLAGAVSHLVLDGVKQWADGANGAYLYPFSWWRNPTPGWYVSADRWVLAASILLVIAILVANRRLDFAR